MFGVSVALREMRYDPLETNEGNIKMENRTETCEEKNVNVLQTFRIS